MLSLYLFISGRAVGGRTIGPTIVVALGRTSIALFQPLDPFPQFFYISTSFSAIFAIFLFALHLGPHVYYFLCLSRDKINKSCMGGHPYQNQPLKI
ncbi:unnamed protein product [Chondrus crispus]|uniref:Uncharacterized protein n=1 Tax=Chondrus crispus TaxID=2769 RepID=R7QDM6_CHOCR|nr:unnamed protein product [Chondrus crispus]CDF36617.1 unnamed protein product [Chondrus crispus]|eukprot:XP_005716436.1 unnamed protein product [Chondrus crispus]